MAEKSFLMLDLHEAKKTAQVLSNSTAQKILEFLSQKPATESIIAKELKLPLSTVHYNLQQLKKVKLVVVEEFHYSKKGRQIDHYKLANKYVIIAPKEKPIHNIKEKLAKILPVALIIGISTWAVHMFNPSVQSTHEKLESAVVARNTVAQDASAGYASEAIATDQALQIAQEPATIISEPNIVFWFLLGAITCLLAYIVIELVYKYFRRS